MRNENDIRKRHETLKAAIAEGFPNALENQAHLDAGSPEQAYYHYGYLSALADILNGESEFDWGDDVGKEVIN